MLQYWNWPSTWSRHFSYCSILDTCHETVCLTMISHWPCNSEAIMPLSHTTFLEMFWTWFRKTNLKFYVKYPLWQVTAWLTSPPPPPPPPNYGFLAHPVKKLITNDPGLSEVAIVKMSKFHAWYSSLPQNIRVC